MCIPIGKNVCVAVVLTFSNTRSSAQKRGLSDPVERRLWNERSLRLWDQDDSIRDHIIAVENSNSSFFSSNAHLHLEHLEGLAFTHSRAYEHRHCGKPTSAMGEHELVSLHEAISRSTRMRNATHIIKVTGRYYMPGFAHILRGIAATDRIIHMQGYPGGCQVMGCRLDACRALWKCPYERYSNCEATIKHRMQRYPPTRRFELPQLQVAFTRAGSSGEPVTNLP